MNNKYLYIGVAVLVVVLAGGWIAYSQYGVMKEEAMMEKGSEVMDKPEDAMMDKASGTMTEDEAMKKPTSTMGSEGAMMQKGSYELYAPEKLALAKDGKVVLFFRASWCPTCRALDANIRANLGSIPKGVAILDVNYDTATALKQKYGVTHQHTLVQVGANGTQIAKWAGSPSLATLLAQVK